MSRADLGKNPEEVAAMFDGVARRYDLFNDLLSLGATKRWRRSVQKIINPKPGMKILCELQNPLLIYVFLQNIYQLNLSQPLFTQLGLLRT